MQTIKIGNSSMNPLSTPPIESLEQDLRPSIATLEQQLNQSLQQLSPARLQVLADFAAYLADQESEAATQELLEIPGLLERIQQQQLVPQSYRAWREIRSDV